MAITISGSGLSITEIDAVSRGETSDSAMILQFSGRIASSRRAITERLAQGEQIYGVTTLFGGLAHQLIEPQLVRDLQKVALWHHRTATGPRLAPEDVRAAMLLRANSLMKGASGIRIEIIERFVTFLNAGAHPHVYQRGSIGASGDLAPLSYIASSILGLDPAFKVDFQGETLDCHTALTKLKLAPLALEAKEGLALINGTAASTAVAANALYRAWQLTSVTFGIHALCAQALLATNQSFAPFVQEMKAHPGQISTAEAMMRLLEGSRTIRDETGGQRGHRTGSLIQDRYSLRCLPQYIGPIVDGLRVASRQIEVEANSANDNPLVDPESGEIYHTGNFLAQYTGVAMDSIRYLIGLLAKHVDVQIALLMTPEFSFGLSGSLVGNTAGKINIGFKSVQVAGNSMMPLIGFFGQSIVDRFPTHAEQFNQNINSQSMNAANLAREQLDVLQHFLAVALLCAVQAVELRAKLAADSYDARSILSPATQELYMRARSAASGPPEASRPIHWDDLDGFLQPKIEGILANIATRGDVVQSMAATFEAIRTD